MTNTEIYYSLFIDSLSANLLFFLDAEYMIWVVSLFQSDHKFFVLLFSVLGFLVASIINYIIGKFIYKISFRFFNTAHGPRYNNFKIVLDQFWFLILWILLLPIIHRFTFILFGFFQINPGKILVLGSLIKLIYYIYYIF